MSMPSANAGRDSASAMPAPWQGEDVKEVDGSGI
jgi:hypothetical protein